VHRLRTSTDPLAASDKDGAPEGASNPRSALLRAIERRASFR
jgi:hypothetical protein